MKKLLFAFLGFFCFVGLYNDVYAQSESLNRFVLTGEVVGNCNDLGMLAYTQSDYVQYVSPKFENGTFLFEYEAAGDFMDVVVGLEDDVFGVRLTAGDTAHVLFTRKEKGKFDINYFGKNEREGRIWTDFYDTYGKWERYNIRMDRDTTISSAQILELIAENDSLFRATHKLDMDSYHRHRADLSRDFLKIIILKDSAYKNNIDPLNIPEYAKIISSIDPNDPLTTACALISGWYYNELKNYSGREILDTYFSFIEQEFGQLTCPSAKRRVAELICNSITEQMEVTSDAKYAKALNRLETLLPDYPKLVAKCRQSFEKYKSARDMVNLPEATLEKIDGTKVNLSDFFGKVLYIDFWATWCGPCVRETPFMEKLAERYKDNDGVEFISISTDDNVEAWRQKVRKDNPFWPQYRIYGNVGDEFLSAVNLKTIPRFMIVLPSGKVFNIDAPRPSEVEAVTAEIDKALRLRK